MLPADPALRPVRLTRRRFALLCCVGLLALLAGAELIARVWLPPLSALDVFVDSDHELANLQDRQRVRIFTGDPVLFWRLQPDLDEVIWDFTLVSTNPQGLRYHRPLGRRPNGGLRGLRIVCVGDSVTFGYRVPVVWPEHPDAYDRNSHPFPRLLEIVLEEANPSQPIEVIPLAVPGYTSHQGLAWLRRDLARLNADIVIVNFGWNDATVRARSDAEAMPPDPLQALLRSVVGRSRLLLEAVAWRQTRAADAADTTTDPPASAPWVARVSEPAYVANVVAMAALAEAHGARTLVLGPVFRDVDSLGDPARRVGAYRTALADGCRREGLEYLEIERLTERDYPANRHLFGESIHPNHYGHRMMATALATRLVERGWLGDLQPPDLERWVSLEFTYRSPPPEPSPTGPAPRPAGSTLAAP